MNKRFHLTLVDIVITARDWFYSKYILFLITKSTLTDVHTGICHTREIIIIQIEKRGSYLMY